ncbi:glutathione S-transferase family protein [Rhizobium sullae]|uniref:Glutathione S-transferase/maleylpyruvate isomerase n=1 Tax=Rhizobium sullae TaxID=50338 RepID=A0A4R3QF17_RHISU|nr:glutathione S-transferase family protein [Rhizobium sullae]TCU18232.1 glutathione S-transferase/maleylpyruvate isomerase [Rhizobium sullae]
MAIEIFWLSGSPYSWRVLLALEIKQASYVDRRLDGSKGDLKSPEYLAINPRGRAPALRDGDFVLNESVAIMAYLDQACPGPKLFGASAGETGQIWRFICECSDYLADETIAAVLPVFSGQLPEKREAVFASVEKVRAEFARIERVLADQDWLVGDAISAADIAVYPFAALALRGARAAEKKGVDLGFLPFVGRYPAVGRWMDRIEALPRYQKTYPPHWRAADVAPGSAA